MSVETDLQQFLANLAFPYPVAQNVISESLSQPRVWYQRRASNQDTFTDGSKSITHSQYAVEVMGLDIDQAEAIAQTIKDRANGFIGRMGFTYVLAMMVEDMEGDYVPKNLNADDGFNIASFQVQIIHQ